MARLYLTCGPSLPQERGLAGVYLLNKVRFSLSQLKS
jgi:hypothetical protein